MNILLFIETILVCIPVIFLLYYLIYQFIMGSNASWFGINTYLNHLKAIHESALPWGYGDFNKFKALVDRESSWDLPRCILKPPQLMNCDNYNISSSYHTTFISHRLIYIENKGMALSYIGYHRAMRYTKRKVRELKKNTVNSNFRPDLWNKIDSKPTVWP
jgi:hypothetical protein